MGVSILMANPWEKGGKTGSISFTTKWTAVKHTVVLHANLKRYTQNYVIIPQNTLNVLRIGSPTCNLKWRKNILFFRKMKSPIHAHCVEEAQENQTDEQCSFHLQSVLCIWLSRLLTEMTVTWTEKPLIKKLSRISDWSWHCLNTYFML